MTSATVTERTRQQGRRLRELRERLGLTRPQLTARLGFTTTQTYDLYERGVTVIRLDRVTDWAEAFGVSEQEFLDAVLKPSRERAGAPWDMAEALRGHILEADIPGFVEAHRKRDIPDQKAAAGDIIAEHHKKVDEATDESIRATRRNRPA